MPTDQTPPPPLCRVQHPLSGRQPGDRIIRCNRPAGHVDGDHDELVNGEPGHVTWSDPAPETPPDLAWMESDPDVLRHQISLLEDERDGRRADAQRQQRRADDLEAERDHWRDRCEVATTEADRLRQQLEAAEHDNLDGQLRDARRQVEAWRHRALWRAQLMTQVADALTSLADDQLRPHAVGEDGEPPPPPAPVGRDTPVDRSHLAAAESTGADPPPGTPAPAGDGHGLILGRAWMDRDGDAWVHRYNAEDFGPVRPVLLVDPSAGPVLERAVEYIAAEADSYEMFAAFRALALAVEAAGSYDGGTGRPAPETRAGDGGETEGRASTASGDGVPSRPGLDAATGSQPDGCACGQPDHDLAEACPAGEPLADWERELLTTAHQADGWDDDAGQHVAQPAPEPAGDGPGWHRQRVAELIAEWRRQDPMDDAADQVEALLADWDRLGELWRGEQYDAQRYATALLEMRQQRDAARAELAEMTAERDARTELDTAWAAAGDMKRRQQELDTARAKLDRAETAIEEIRQLVGYIPAKADEDPRLVASTVRAWTAEVRRHNQRLGEQLAEVSGQLAQEQAERDRLRSLASRLALMAATVARGDAPKRLSKTYVAELLADARRAGLLPDETEAGDG